MSTATDAPMGLMPARIGSKGPAKEETFIAGGERQLLIRSWRPADEPRAIFAIVPGFNSHSGHYQWLASQLTRAGLSVYAVDLRGRGRSSGTRFHVEAFDDYIEDVHTMLDFAHAHDPGLPVFLMGHSAGGVIATAYALQHQTELAGLVSESYALEVPAPGPVLAFVQWVSRYLPRLRVLKLPNQQFSRNADTVATLDADPLIKGEKQTALAVSQMLAGVARLKQGFRTLTLPVLIMHGTDDRVTLPKGSELFYAEVGSNDRTLHLYEGHYHDLFNDLEREIPMAHLAQWLTAHLMDHRASPAHTG